MVGVRGSGRFGEEGGAARGGSGQGEEVGESGGEPVEIVGAATGEEAGFAVGGGDGEFEFLVFFRGFFGAGGGDGADAGGGPGMVLRCGGGDVDGEGVVVDEEDGAGRGAVAKAAGGVDHSIDAEGGKEQSEGGEDGAAEEPGIEDPGGADEAEEEEQDEGGEDGGVNEGGVGDGAEGFGGEEDAGGVSAGFAGEVAGGGRLGEFGHGLMIADGGEGAGQEGVRPRARLRVSARAWRVGVGKVLRKEWAVPELRSRVSW